MITQPYVGLRPFKQYEHEIFFGREKCVNELTELLIKTNFIAVVSEAYCGKTSLVHCGLETKLLNDTETQWHIANFQPYSNPFVQLATSLLKDDVLGEHLSFNTKDAVEGLKQVLAYGDLSLYQLLEQNHFPKDHKLLLVCDQFEDIFNLYEQNKSLAEKFVQLLVSSAKKHPKKIKTPYDIYVVVTLRSNYLDKVSLFPDLDQIIRNNIYLVPHLNKAQLKEAIIKPALFFENQKNNTDEDENSSTEDHPTDQKDFFENDEGIDAVYRKIERNELFSDDSKINNEKENHEEKQTVENIEPKLVEFLLNNVSGSGDQLPLLQHLLMRMWELSLTGLDHSSLTMEMYKKTRVGGFNEALPRHLEETYYSLKENQREIAKSLFRQLVEVKNNQQSSLLHVPVKIAEVAKLEQTSVEEIIKVIETFRKPERGFLIPAFPEKLSAVTLVEISHESILLHWTQLAGWKKEERRAERNYRELNTLAHQYYEEKGTLLQKIQKQKNELWQWSESEGAVTQTWAEHYGCDFDLIERYLLKSKNLFAYFHKYYTLPMYSALFVISILIIGVIFFPLKQERFVPLEKNALEILYQTEKELILKKEAFYLEKKCNKAIIDKPNSTHSWFHCGYWLAYQGKLDEAEAAYEKSRELEPDNADTLLQLAKIWVIKKRFDEAEPILNGLLAKDPENSDILYQLGEILSHEDSLKKSRDRQLRLGIHYYQTALAFSPKNDKILSQLGRTFSLLGDHKQAFEHLKKAVEINPQNVDAWYNLGNEYIKNAQIDAGVKALENITEITPNNLKYWRILGHLHMKNAKPEEADKAFTKALGLKPDDDDNWRNLGAALLRKGDLVKATEAFEKAVTLNKYNDVNHRNLGNIWMKKNKFNAALKSYNAALKIKASKINLIKKADVLTMLNKHQKASNLYKQAAVMKDSDWE
jgi:tetratricopeptide (TPR) repeat protein